MFVSQLLDAAVVRWPRRAAIIDGTRELTFAELGARVGRLANALLGLGLQPGDRVLDLQKNHHTYVESDLACAVAGLIRVPINPRLTSANLRFIATDAGARALIFGSEFAGVAEELLAEVPSLEVGIAAGGEGPGRDYEDLLARAAETVTPRFEQPGEILGLHYSSGTTGRPKGCIRTAANRLVSAQDMLASVCEGRLGPDDAFVHAGPLTHASGLFVLPHLAAGAKQVLMSSFDAEELAATIDRHAITGTVLVPTMVERLLAALPDGRSPEETLPSLRRLAYAGAPMAPDRIELALARLGPRLVQFYGMVEAIPPLTVLSRSDHERPERLTAAGRPALGAACRLVDEGFVPVPVGATGELLVGGSHVMPGYWEDEDSTGKTLKEGWLRTGDLARMDPDGLIHLGDRRADMIITGGYNVMPREIEDAISREPGVAEVAVVGIKDAEWGEVVTAVVVAEAGARPLEAAIRDRCANTLPGFKKPRAIHFVETLPKGATGKVVRREVRRQVEAEPTPR